jgi:phosphate transport system protein
MTRDAFIHELSLLRERVVTMGSMVDKAILRSVEALTTQNVALAREVVRNDAPINDFRWATEDETFKVIAIQAPIASDLRTCLSVVSIVTDLERMGDHAVGIAKTVIETADEPGPRKLGELPEMAAVARKMLGDSLTAFIREDVDLALEIINRDDSLDALYKSSYSSLVQSMVADPTTVDRCTKLIWVGHNLERIGDRVTNICERVIYSVKGVVNLPLVTAHKEDIVLNSAQAQPAD